MRSAGGVAHAPCPIVAIDVQAYTIPTEEPEESDGTLTWSSTTMVLVEVHAGGHTGVGYTYADESAATVIHGMLCDVLLDKDALQTQACYGEMCARVRNNGRTGIAAMAISAVDIALWDVKAKIAGLPVAALLGTAREEVPIYGSGGFTSYTIRHLVDQLAFWVHQMGIPRVKMKVGRDDAADVDRVGAVRDAIGKDAQIFVDANGAYSAKHALAMAGAFAKRGVSWFEEPVYHNDLEGNRFVRERAPAVMEISNGEYGFAPFEFRRIIDAGAADVLQADVTRCGGYSGFLAVDGLCEAYNIPLSSHCAPYVTLPVACAAKMLRHIEYFHDHVRIEKLLFDGVTDPQNGMLRFDWERPGIGLEFKRVDAEGWRV